VARGLDAVAWVKAAAAVVDGSGGGRPDMAQAGGKGVEKIAEALQVARGSIEEMLSSKSV
jgi:alanyl-tRNA synthetase